MFRHCGIEAIAVDTAAFFAQRVLGEVEREAVGVVKLERRIARKVRAIRQVRQFIIQKLQATIQSGLEPHFFVQKRFFDELLALTQFRIGRAHLLHQSGHQFVHHGVFRTQQMRVTHRAAHDPAENVAAPFV